MNKEFNPPIRIYPFSSESQNWLVPIVIGYLIVYHIVIELLINKNRENYRFSSLIAEKGKI